MNVRRAPLFAILALALGSAVPSSQAQDKANEEEALVKAAEAFVEAFHQGDAKKLASFWTEDGDYTNQEGKTIKGREAIEKGFQKFFARSKGLKLRIDIASLRFVTPDVAIEDGTNSVLHPDGAPPSTARYTIVHVKKDGKWILSSVREAPYAAPSNHEHLSSLDWLIGDWAAESSKGETARVEFSWTPSQNFIVATYTTTFQSIAMGGGTQWIGWDPIAKTIRAWTFEANGGFGEGAWSVEGDKVVIKATIVMRDGKKLAATNTMTRVDDDTVTWQSKERTEDGKPLPDVPAITFKRSKQ